MKAKTIKSVLRRKLNEWTEHIEDERVRKLVEDNTIVTGGAIVSLLTGEKVNDFDVYLKSPEGVFEVARYYVEQFKKNPPTKFKNDGGRVDIYLTDGYGAELKHFNDWKRYDEKSKRLKVIVKSAGVANEDGAEAYEYFEGAPDPNAAEEFAEQATHVAEDSEDADKPRFRPVFLTSNAITLSDNVQIVVRFYGEPESIHANYDFVHCCNYWQSWDGYLSLRTDALECIINKELRYVGSKYPVCSVFRTRKFLERGWHINAGQYLKMALQIAELDLTDPEVLEDQLTGVDAAYFQEIIALCKQRMEETGKKTVDQAYLVQLIDRIF